MHLSFVGTSRVSLHASSTVLKATAARHHFVPPSTRVQTGDMDDCVEDVCLDTVKHCSHPHVFPTNTVDQFGSSHSQFL